MTREAEIRERAMLKDNPFASAVNVTKDDIAYLLSRLQRAEKVVEAAKKHLHRIGCPASSLRTALHEYEEEGTDR